MDYVWNDTSIVIIIALVFVGASLILNIYNTSTTHKHSMTKIIGLLTVTLATLGIGGVLMMRGIWLMTNMIQAV